MREGAAKHTCLLLRAAFRWLLATSPNREITHRLNFVPQGNCSWDCCHDNSPQHKTINGQLSNYEGNGNENGIKNEFAFYQTYRWKISKCRKFFFLIQKDKENSSLCVHVLQTHHIAHFKVVHWISKKCTKRDNTCAKMFFAYTTIIFDLLIAVVYMAIH